MQYVKLGRSGVKVSRIALGCMSYGDPAWRDWVLPEEHARPFFERALELGINFFDTADMYSLGRSEEITGKALRDLARRDEIVLATKVHAPMGDGVNQRGLSRKHILDGVHASLRRLGTDYIDLYQIHGRDPDTSMDETLGALHDLVRLGMVRYIGVSNHYAYQVARAQYLADLRGWSRFVSVQDQYSLLYREEEREMLPLCREEGIGFLPWSPLARGFLAGNRRGDEGQTTRGGSDVMSRHLFGSDADQEIVRRVDALAHEKGVTASQVALAWVLRQPGVTAPIIGATKAHHLEQAVAAVDLTLTDDEARSLEAPYVTRPSTLS
ncbi:aryl-alcohol dehydrogenase-like predicted oxidoreductase [Deinococcus metalli]|uniref:Aldo/keto reductase n=1 Tax=Deinococcus metalli TaxID=1141878 RepID=A0A7W8KJ87_9DEIO|nr:aldo/keto reductase [Deinococcus metalli]MBB5378915.1 aryl-alcohol dehydrogenase-like predicted oxidoreductase [Deinococcus metalli]GHF62717.1 aldo/keto reductase [Deinococcus metalli]